MARDVLHKVRPIQIAQQMGLIRKAIKAGTLRQVALTDKQIAEARARMEKLTLGVVTFEPLLQGESGPWYEDVIVRFVLDPDKSRAWYALVETVCADRQLDDILLSELLVGAAQGFTRPEQFYPLVGLPQDMIDRMMGNVYRRNHDTTA